MFTNEKKKHFIKSRDNIKRRIWDLEFKKFQSMDMREGIRLDRDRAMEKADAFEAELKRDHKGETKKELEKNLATVLEDVKRYEKQIQMIDNEVNGVPYTPASEGVEENIGQQGINETIEGLHVILKMYNNYIKSL